MSKGNDNPYASPMTKPVQHQQSGPGQLASLGDRFLGSFLDGLIVMVPFFIIMFVIGIALGMAGLQVGTLAFQVVSLVLSFVMFNVVYLGINGYFLATKGQTVGKMIVKTQIVGEDGALVPFGQLYLKRYLALWLVSFIPYVGYVVGLVDALLVFRGNRKCLHDEIAGTKVISLK